MDLIEVHFREQKNPGFYANQLNMTLWRINRLARIYHQKTVYQLVQDRIHREAELLLRTTLMTAKEIAFEVGVCDPAYFSNCFKRVTGLTPLKYREKTCSSFLTRPSAKGFRP
ncbi:helix-turn-helix domain-containing protein [Pedobacter sp. HMWF019]|uniref:helix-turn-helix domain-containing protein n=1 Tax=Pedobacter sp. HMWF019 TaxID=2056856 RepID=UPI001304B06F|nr:helix-turn-helix domain-containing protein [Pedobacter sp. HMWF019]